MTERRKGGSKFWLFWGLSLINSTKQKERHKLSIQTKISLFIFLSILSITKLFTIIFTILVYLFCHKNMLHSHQAALNIFLQGITFLYNCKKSGYVMLQCCRSGYCCHHLHLHYFFHFPVIILSCKKPNVMKF